ncbi:PH domain-containing protein [Paenibacillus harenae]|uniref:Membrane protein n=1 Tax=Paenibacillus harenae TaxID=306543 RepID=A0ABT9UAZ6_PAEHA|nr:PH domain-containing protein [Paenibacillus harenae]MDQ0115634.1 putative membrane protein [Paenibacillus harenae]
MNETQRRKLHPVYVSFALVNTIQGFIPFILIALVRGTAWSELDWYWYAGGSALTVLLLLLGYMEWRKFGFWLEADRIIIRKGVFFRDEKTIYFTRIHSVNVEQQLVHRLLRVAQVKIETPGGNKKADGILPALSISEANHIRLVLRGQIAADPDLQDREAEAGVDTHLHQGESAVQAASSEDNTTNMSHARTDLDDSQEDAGFRLDATKLLKAAATSMNFGLVAAFAAGLYSFADDFIQALLPDHFFENVVEDSASLMPGYLLIGIIVLFGLVAAWVLSILLYILKYSGYTARRVGKEISVSYGLLERKTFLFDPKKVQAVIVKEGLLRQALGHAEVKLQIVSSDKNEQMMLHPYISRAEIPMLLEAFVPQLKDAPKVGFAGAPKRALLYYVRTMLLITIVLCGAAIVVFKSAALWSLLLLPLVIGWRYACYKSAGLLLENGQLTLRRRFIGRSTYLIRRPQIVVMRVKRSRSQMRKQLLTLSVQAMGSPFDYRVACLEQTNVEQVWHWYSRRSSQ